MKKPNLPLEVYVLLDIAPIFVIFILCFGISYSQLCFHLYMKFKNSRRTNHLSMAMNRFFSWMTSIAFGPPEGVFRYEPEQQEEWDEHLGTKTIYLGRKKVNSILVVMLGSYVFVYFLFAIMVSWDIFLLSESYECNNKTIDCFEENGDPITDCNKRNVTTQDQDRITCYTFSFSFGAALGAFGGLLSMIRIMMKVISAVFLWAYTKYSGDKCKRVFLVHLLLIFSIPIVISITVFVYVVLFSTSFLDILSIVLFYFSLLIAVCFPWCLFADTENSSQHGNHSERAENRISIVGGRVNDESTPINY